MATNREKSLLNRMFDGRYLILRKLGSGGMAEVYLAEDQELGRKVALKMLDDRHARDEQFVERFKREARNAAGLSHPHIVQIYDRGQAEGTYYIAMEYLDGPTLKEMLVRKGPTPPQTAIKFAREILSALAEAHRHQIVHRDIKPHNVIVGSDWQIKVTDFGIARSGESQMTEVGAIVGTAQYLSPEQARGAPVDQRSDLYSLGIVLYEMLTGTVPFSGDAAVEIAMKHLTTVPLPPSTLRPEISHALDAVVMRALAKEPDDRYASAEEMDADLARVAAGRPPSYETEAALTQIMSSPHFAYAPTVIRRSPPPSLPETTPVNGYGPESAAFPLPPTRRRRSWPVVLWLVALLILAAAAYLGYHQISAAVRGSGTVAVADVMATSYAGAEINIRQEGLDPQLKYMTSTTYAAGLVMNESPGVGTVVKKKSVVTLTVSSGLPKVTVQSFKGESLSSAEATLAADNLKATIHRHFSSSPPNTVTAQDPDAGATLTVGEAVVLNVSNGPKTTAVPNVIGESFAAAQSTLKDSGFSASEQLINSSAEKGNVTAQDPGPNASEPKGTTIVLSVSEGPKTLPVTAVVGDNETDAESLLTNAGFVVTVESQTVSDPTQVDLVTEQVPAANTEVPAGSTVTIYVGSLITPTTSTPATTTSASTTTDTTTTGTTTTGTTTTATTTTTGAVTTPTTVTTPPSPPSPAAPPP